MITAIIIILVAFGWLFWETDCMRVRLLVGKVKPIDKNIPYWWQPVKDNMIMCKGCDFKCHKDKEQWTGWKLPAKTVKICGSTINFNEGCNMIRASLLRDMAQSDKPRKPSFKPCQLPIDAFIKTMRIGSHNEWVETTPKHGFHRIVEEYTTHYHDCLPGKDWLKEHEHSLDNLEPSIDILVDGELKASFNGDYKKGMITNTLKPYTKTVRAGKKTITVTKEGHVVNMGGGAYIAVNE